MSTDTIDSAVLDMLADEKVVDLLATILDCERAIQGAYVSSEPGPSSSWGGSPSNDRRRYVGGLVRQQQERRKEALEALALRVQRLGEDIARAEREEASA